MRVRAFFDVYAAAMDARRAAEARHRGRARAADAARVRAQRVTRTGGWSDSGPRSSTSTALRRPAFAVEVVDVVAAEPHHPGQLRLARAMLTSPPNSSGAPLRPLARRVERLQRVAHARAPRTWVEECTLTTHEPSASRTPCAQRRSGRQVSRTLRCSAIVPRTRIALQPPPLDFRMSGLREEIARRSAQPEVARRQHRALLRARRARPGAAATTAAPPAAARRPIPSPRAPPRTRSRATARRASGCDRGRGSRSMPASRTLHHRRRAGRRPARPAAASRRGAEGGAAVVAGARGPHGRAAVQQAVDAHAHVVRVRRVRARRPSDDPARRRAAAHARRVRARHGAGPLPPRGGDRPAHGRRGRARRRSPSTPPCRS